MNNTKLSTKDYAVISLEAFGTALFFVAALVLIGIIAGA